MTPSATEIFQRTFSGRVPVSVVSRVIVVLRVRSSSVIMFSASTVAARPQAIERVVSSFFIVGYLSFVVGEIVEAVALDREACGVLDTRARTARMTRGKDDMSARRAYSASCARPVRAFLSKVLQSSLSLADIIP